MSQQSTVVHDATELVQLATARANAAGKEWLDKAQVSYTVRMGNAIVGTMLDICGNAHVQFRDKRSKFYKEFVKAGLVRKTGNGVVEIAHAYRGRQELGLAQACANAAKSVLEDHGVQGLRIWEYID